MIIILMGVAGSGKTTIGRSLSSRTGWPFLEGDDFHSQENREKMRSGIPLTEDDRLPWLQELARQIRGAMDRGENLIVACSALKESHRALLRHGHGELLFVHLRGSRDLIRERMEARRHPFMTVQLLDSQFSALEAPKDALAIDIHESPDSIVRLIEAYLPQMQVGSE